MSQDTELSGPAAFLIIVGVAAIIILVLKVAAWVGVESVHDKCKAGTSIIIEKEIFKCQKVGDL